MNSKNSQHSLLIFLIWLVKLILNIYIFRKIKKNKTNIYQKIYVFKKNELLFKKIYFSRNKVHEIKFNFGLVLRFNLSLFKS